VEQLISGWLDFCEILYLSVFPKFVKKIQVLLNVTRITVTLDEELW